MRRHRRPRVIQEKARLEFLQSRPLPAIFDGGRNLPWRVDAGDLLNVFALSIIEGASDVDSLSKADKANDNDGAVMMEDAEAKNPGKAKQASAKTAATKTLAIIAEDCNGILEFLQAVAVKSP